MADKTFSKFLLTYYQIIGKEKIIKEITDRLNFVKIIINDPYEVQRFLAFNYAIKIAEQSLSLELKQMKILKEEFKYLLIQILLK